MVKGFTCSFFEHFLGVLFEYFLLRLSHKKTLYDHIDERKVHTEQIPRLDGVSFISAHMVVIFTLTALGFWGEQFSFPFSHKDHFFRIHIHKKTDIVMPSLG